LETEVKDPAELFESWEKCKDCRPYDQPPFKCPEHSKPAPEEPEPKIIPLRQIGGRASTHDLLEGELAAGTVGQSGFERLPTLQDEAEKVADNKKLQRVLFKARITEGKLAEIELANWKRWHPKYNPNPHLKNFTVVDAIYLKLCRMGDGRPVRKNTKPGKSVQWKARRSYTNLCEEHYREYVKALNRWKMKKRRNRLMPVTALTITPAR